MDNNSTQNVALPKTSVNTEPSKRFFVEMLTRDISLEDAILDMLDNSVDGILRVIEQQGFDSEDNSKPYFGYYAHINFNKDSFEVKDNCGGIPENLIERALKLGRPYAQATDQTDPKNSVGVYGIGMKRALFKIGEESLILTQNQHTRYQVLISADWLKSNDWNLALDQAPNPFPFDGTEISIGMLHSDISDILSAEYFQDKLLEMISSHYAIIISKGFEVRVNGISAEPRPVLFKFDEKADGAIRPYIFRAQVEDVAVYLAVGLRLAIPTQDELDEEQEAVHMSSKDAGWTVICNDRVVVSNNKDELTGWGTANIPNYHNQFRSIIGVVEFTGNPAKLPTTTTKRGLDLQSALYQQVLNRMREGLRLFIDYTNRWKTRESEAKAQVSFVPNVGFPVLKAESQNITFKVVEKTGLKGERYKPELPVPPSSNSLVRITYSKDRDDVKEVASEIIPDYDSLKESEVRKLVGEKTFDVSLQNIIQKREDNNS